MATRTISKSLITEDDIAYGKGTVAQTRNGGAYTLNKVTKIVPVDSIAERDALDTDKFQYCQLFLAGSPALYAWSGTTWEELVIVKTKYESFAAIMAADLSTLNEAETVGFYPGWAGTLAGPEGGASYHRDGDTGTATTAYADNSGFYDAMGDGFSLSTEDGVNVRQFGALGDGVADDTAAFQKALDFAASNNKWVWGNSGDTYLASMLVIKNGTAGVDTQGGVILPNGTTTPSNLTTEAAVVLQGALTGGAAVQNCKLSLTIDMQNGDRTAILGDGCLACTFTGNKIYGFTNDAINNHRGIRLQEGAARNRIFDNEIVGALNPTQRGLLLDLWCSTVSGFTNFGGFFTGTVVQQGAPAERNVITNNTLTNGSYALNLQGGEYNIFSNNTCYNQNHRGVWTGNGSWYNTISDNLFVNFTSAAILMDYSCCHNVIANNNCRNEGAVGIGGEAVININTGASYNLIVGNYCDAPLNYSVYIATDSSYNMVDGNFSKNAYVAAFAVENDWIDTRPANNFYSRPNYGDPTLLDPPNSTSWTYNDLVGTVFQNNIVHSGYTGRTIAVFSIAQIQNTLVGATPTKLREVTLKNNQVLTNTNIGYGIYQYQHIAGQLEDVTFDGNKWVKTLLATVADFAAGTPSAINTDFRAIGLVFAHNNGQLDDLINGTAIVFADGDTTPSVKDWGFFLCTNTGATSITDFDDARAGQEIIVRGDVNTTIVYASGLIRPKGLVNVTGMNSNSIISFMSGGGVWHEMWRNF